MKKIICTLIFPLVLFACNNKKTSNEAVGKDVDSYRQVGVENVNGNIPDTGSSIDLSTRKDTSKTLTDSSRMRDSLQ